MELNKKQNELLQILKKLPCENEVIDNYKENGIICAILIGTQEGLLDKFIEIAQKSIGIRDALNKIFDRFPELEAIDDELLTEEEL